MSYKINDLIIDDNIVKYNKIFRRSPPSSQTITI
ncbi:MAG: hypothetical protein Faunusvirus9_6 [Faunusvirus sp.]|uniref:Uncharacterized protein n=1 Tax=Faunusvirus sp. TaxID=2487766 RepID=A0A3G4ZWN8_9VIRU|nr:MAG: hypothetical protein Faunusvirus9_6 [Faunusvirus sp.]